MHYTRIFLGFALSLLLLTGTAQAEDFPISPPGSYTNNPDVAGECLPSYNWPTFGKCCRKIKEETASSSSSSGSSPTGFFDEGSSSSSSSSSGSSGGFGGECPGPDQEVKTVSTIDCDDQSVCTQDCIEGTPVCAEYGTNPTTGACECTKWQTPVDCRCAPKCTIADPVNYPHCCSVTPKGADYPCLVTCTLPNGDKVDIEENPPRCKRFKECCYGKKDDGGAISSWDPVETEPGDPRDYCKLKCMDVCNDKQLVPRSKTASDIFPECCTPPIPIQVACACCRDKSPENNQASSQYCEYFRRFFNCDAATLSCPADPALDHCAMTVDKKQSSTATGLAEYDPNHDPYLTFDPRYAFCSGKWTNRNCRYICRGKGILVPPDTPTAGIWRKDYIDSSGNPVENNYALQVHGNCTDAEGQEVPVPWPPPNAELETCEDGSTASSSSTTSGGSSNGCVSP